MTNCATLTVRAVNNAPVALDDTSYTAEDVPVTISPLDNDSDVDGDSLTITSVTATNGTAVIVGGTNVLFTPATNFNGTATIGYTINDGNGGTTSALITVTVGAVNDAPVAADDAANATEDVPVTISPLDNDSDVDGDVLTIISVSPTNGTAVIVGGTNVVFTPATNFNGTATIGYTISDGNGGTNSALITVTVSAVNDAPVAADDAANTAEDVPVTISPLDNDSDVDGDSLTIISVSPTNGTAVIVGGTNVLFTPAANFNGTATIGYSISDGNGGTASALITVTVSPVNDPPVAADDSYTMNADTTLPVSAPGVLANDTDTEGNGLSAVLVNLPAHGSLAFTNDGSFSYIPAPSYNGTDSFTYKANDGTADSGTATVTITVIPASTIANGPSDLIRCPGQSASFIVSAAGTGPFTYQWRKDRLDVPGAAEASFDIGSVNAANAGNYCVVVTGAAGSVTNCASLTVNAPSTATAPGEVTVCQGADANFSTTGSGTGQLGYQWTLDGVPVGGNGPILTVNTLSLSAGDHLVRVTVTGQCGAASSSGTLTVQPGTSASGPTDATVCLGQDMNFATAANGVGPVDY